MYVSRMTLAEYLNLFMTECYHSIPFVEKFIFKKFIQGLNFTNILSKLSDLKHYLLKTTKIIFCTHFEMSIS